MERTTTMVKVCPSNVYRAYCILCKRDLSTAPGSNTACRQHSCIEGHKPKEGDVKTSSNSHLFFGNGSKDFKKVAGKLVLVFHTVKHNSYTNVDCINDLSALVLKYIRKIYASLTAGSIPERSVDNEIYCNHLNI
jgi:hypothetical protein